MSTSVRNTLVLIFVAVGISLSFYYLERAFRRGDIRRSIEAVQQTRLSPDGPTILEDLVKQYGADAKINWVARTEDNFKGWVLVLVTLPDQTVRRYRVDIVRGTVSPLSSLTP
jgi:hypothetical protein